VWIVQDMIALLIRHWYVNREIRKKIRHLLPILPARFKGEKWFEAFDGEKLNFMDPDLFMTFRAYKSFFEWPE